MLPSETGSGLLPEVTGAKRRMKPRPSAIQISVFPVSSGVRPSPVESVGVSLACFQHQRQRPGEAHGSIGRACPWGILAEAPSGATRL